MNKKYLTIASILTILTLPLVGCKNNDVDISSKINSKEEPTLTISQSSLILKVGEKERLVAVASDGSTVSFLSEDDTIADVDQTGLVSAISVGKTNIIIKTGFVEKTCPVEVVKADDENDPTKEITITLDKNNVTLTEGETEIITATIENSTDDVVWTSSSSDVATVTVDASNSKIATIKALSKGTATITASIGTVSKTCTVTVNETVAPVTITLSQETATIQRGGSLQLSATASDNSNITWSSSDESKAKVTTNGLVNAFRTGEVTITATAGLVSKDCVVTITYTQADDYKASTFGDEKNSVAAPDEFRYWNDQNWCKANVSVIESYTNITNDIFHLEYEYTSGTNWYSMQLFKQLSNVQINATYNISFNLFSSEEGDITVCGHVIHIVSGNNEISITTNYTDSAKALFSVQFGTGNPTSFISSGCFDFSNLVIVKDESKVNSINDVSLRVDNTNSDTSKQGVYLDITGTFTGTLSKAITYFDLQHYGNCEKNYGYSGSWDRVVEISDAVANEVDNQPNHFIYSIKIDSYADASKKQCFIPHFGKSASDDIKPTSTTSNEVNFNNFKYTIDTTISVDSWAVGLPCVIIEPINN